MTEFCIDTDTVICLYIYVCDTFTWCLNALRNVNTFTWNLNALCNVNNVWNVICWLYNLPRVNICNTGYQQSDFCLLPLLCDKRRKNFSTIVDSCIYIYIYIRICWSHEFCVILSVISVETNLCTCETFLMMIFLIYNFENSVSA